MRKGLEHPRETDEAQHMQELIEFMTAHQGIVLSPIIFVRGWLENRIKIFTARDDNGKIIGMTICPLVEDPITGGHKWWVSFAAGEDLQDIVTQAMSIYEVVK